MRTRKHYVNLLESNPGTTWGLSLAAQAVYAAKNGMFDRNHNFDEGYYRKTYLRLQAQYGEALNPAEVRDEMDLVSVMSRLGSRTSEKKPQRPAKTRSSAAGPAKRLPTSDVHK